MHSPPRVRKKMVHAGDLVKEGPWGGKGGRRWTYLDGIRKIFITYDDRFIRTIQFTSQIENGDFVVSEQFGRKLKGKFSDEVNFDPKEWEALDCVSGTIGSFYNRRMITSLCFTATNGKMYGPFGNATGERFSSSSDALAGLHGRSSFWIDAIGVYQMVYTDDESEGEESKESKEVSEDDGELGLDVVPWGSQEGGENWSYEPEGAISRISITHDDVIYSIQFTSKDEDGNLDQSKTFGHETSRYSDKIEIDINKEKLNNISGTVGEKDGSVVITSLSFGTNNGKSFGPYGTASGTPFSLSMDDGFIRGFYGRAGAWLDAIGVHIDAE